MIVVDTNVLLYLYIPGPHTENCIALLEQDNAWFCPPVWRSEFCNTLLLYLRKKLLTREFADEAIEAATQLVSHHASVPAPHDVMTLALAHKLSFYDSEFAALAQTLSTALVTEDKALLRAFPDQAITIAEALATK